MAKGVKMEHENADDTEMMPDYATKHQVPSHMAISFIETWN